MDKEKILDILVDTRAPEDVYMELTTAIRRKDKKVVSTINPNAAVVTLRDGLFRKAMLDSEIVIPDGLGIVMASRFLGGMIKRRFTGSDLLAGLSDFLNKNGKNRYFFYGCTDDVLKKLSDKVGREFPNIEIAGSYAPPFGDFSQEENEKSIKLINSANPDVLWVAMTAPKQEKWVYENRDRLNAKVIASIGAAFDYYAGTKNRGPVFLQWIGLEWLFRFFREPRRMWKRNLVSTPVFIYHVLKARLK
ncbi:MAG: WecB/TagA/CpsF family glycosyltransferase [Candidatus Omnitrophota bacterium]|nr:WecB/TagA/CpsF family glycosyltransferase [Candidatus Omnitrophota bacterium]